MSDMSASISEAPILDLSPRVNAAPLPNVISRIAQQSGRTPAALVRAFAGLAVGPGRISFADFVRLRLFDLPYHADAKLEAYVGQRRNRDLCVTANHRHDWLGLLGNKVASLSYLAAYGFPTIEIKAIFAPHMAVVSKTTSILADRETLASFLMNPDNYPLFGKPVEGFQSLGSIGLRNCRVASREIERLDGSIIALDQFMDEISVGFPAGYLFQTLIAPHADIGRLCNDRVATVRLLTLAGADGPHVFRAAWKLPARGNVADNFWRPGNLLAQLDLASGRVGHVISGAGLDLVAATRHPDTDMLLTGFCHPHWDAMKAVAIEAARLMRHVPLIGWDIACTQDGPVIVEMNETPDFFLIQMAERKGVLDDVFADFMKFQQLNAQKHLKANKAAIARL